MSSKNHDMADTSDNKYRRRGMKGGSAAGPIFGMGMIGALVYYLQQASTFWEGVLGVLKALVWPAMLVYHLLGHLNM